MASKLDRYLNVLEALIDRPRKIDQIARKARVDRRVLRRYLSFLVSNGVVEKRRLRGVPIAYAITERGFSVFKTLRALKYLEKLRDSLPIVEEAREIVSILPKSKRSR